MSQFQDVPPSVIWTRRVLVLAVLGGLIWGVVAAVGGVISWVGGFFNPSQPTMVAGANCQPQQIRVEAHVGTATKEYQGAFNPGEYPYLWFTVTNTGPVECKFNVGTSVTYYTITSGNDNIWTSKDCKVTVPRTDFETILQPSVTVAADVSDWQRVRSSSAGCSIADGQPEVGAGGASYVLKAEVNGVISENTTQFVLN